jgi:predicted phosphodiesterase
MRLAVLADIQGNLPALEAMLANLHHHDVDGVIVAGDLVGGLRPRESIQLLRSLSGRTIP